jgi:hypothetical protein
MASLGGGKASRSAAWRRIAAAGPLPWVLSALLVGASTVATVVLAPPTASPLQDTSRDRVAALLASQGADLVTDTDRDGLPDTLENYAYGSDPARWNTSGTPIPDGWLAGWGYEPTDPAVGSQRMAAPPADRLPASYKGVWPDAFAPTLLEVYRFGRPANWSEPDQGPFENGVDPREWDADGDGLPDAWLLAHGVDPATPGLRDQRLAGPGGLTVLEAYQAGTDPTRLDSDGDGLEDTAELAGRGTWSGRALTFPRTDPARFSTGGSGVCDGFLVGHGLDPVDPRPGLSDVDHDGATTLAEFAWTANRTGAQAACSGPVGLDPTRASSGPSGLPDGWFLRYGLDPLAASADTVTDEAPAQGDLPAVTLTLRREYEVNRPPAWNESRSGPWWGGSDPTRPDTDGDGLPDADEVRGWAVNATRIPGGPPGRPVAVGSDPARADGDGDLLGDGDERAARTHPGQRDTDFDGLDDGAEIALDLELAGEDPPANRTRLDPTRADSAGDLLTDGERMALLANASARAENGDDYPFPGGGARSYDAVAHLHPGAADLPSPAPGPLLAELFGPAGDLDADGLPNLLDQDVDGDGIPNGAEARPELYEPSGFEPTTIARRATDPLNLDSDGDRLLDGWEVLNSVPNPDAGANDPEPALHDTDGDGVPDGDEDPDGDAMRTVRFGQGAGQPFEYVHHNANEQQFRTKPHVASSDEDGLDDGWKVYWGLLYPGATGGVPRPVPGVAQPSVPIPPQLAETRFTTVPLDREAFETPVGPPLTVHLRGGVTRTVQALQAAVPWTFHSVQENRTNPFLQDTDLDLLLDAWEIYHSQMHARPAADVLAGSCVAVGGNLDPLQPDSGDADGDGLTAFEEQTYRTDPLCKDSDLGGLADGAEVDAGLSPADPQDDLGGSDPTRDGDLDGLSDLCEVLGDHDCDGSPDGDPTDPANPDSDGDGLLDGRDLEFPDGSARARELIALGLSYLRFGGKVTVHGERGYSDPTLPSTRPGAEGIPDGWVRSHGSNPRPGWLTCYEHGLPLWWDLAIHGPWWGGAMPSTTQDCAQLTAGADVDQDGLRDAVGEDPIPVANHANHFPLGTPFVPGLAPLEVRQRAQAIVDPHTVTDSRVLRQPWTGPPVVLREPRLEVGAVPAVLVRGENATVTGRLVDPVTNLGVAGATILVTLSGAEREPFGANFTRADGTFSVPVALTPSHSVAIPADGRRYVLRSQTEGTVTWETALEGLTPGTRTLAISSYALNRTATAPAYAAQAAPGRQVTVMHRDQLEIEAPERARPGEAFAVTVIETDAAGLPRTDPIQVTWNGETLPPREVGSDGRAVLTLVAPAEPGVAALLVETLPPAGSGVLSGSASADVQVQELATLVLDPVQRSDAGGLAVISGRASTPARPLAFEAVEVRLSRPDGQPLANDTSFTDSQGRFSVGLPLNLTSPPGAYIVLARLAAQDTHTDAATSGVLPVRGHVQLQEASSPAIASSGARTVSASLLDASGRGVQGRTLHLALGDDRISATTDAAGVARFALTRLLRSGPHLQEVTFEGDGEYGPASLVRERTVRAPTHLAMTVADGRPGGSLPVRLVLTEESGLPLAGRAVRAALGDGTAATALTDASGAAALELPVRGNAAPGPVAVRGSFAGDGPGSYAASENRSVARLAFGAAFAVPGRPVLLGEPVPSARLVDERGLPLRRATVGIVDAAGVATVATTNDDGAFALLRPEQVPGEPADVPLKLRYAGDLSHQPAEAAFTLAFRLPAALRMDAPRLVAGETAVLRVSALADGQELLQGTVRAALGNASGAASIGGTGVASLPLRVGPAERGGLLRVSFTHPAYAAEDLVLDVPVAARTTLEASAARAGADGGSLLLRVKALAGGEALRHANLTVLVAGVRMPVTTDAEGLVSLEMPLPAEAAAVQVLFAGDGGSTPATFASILRPGDLQAAAVPSWGGPAVLGATLAFMLLAVAAAVVARRRSHPILRALLAAQRTLEARGLHEADVLACYATLQDGLVEAGVLRGPAATPRSLAEELARAMPLGHGRAPLDRLIGVFESARYSARMATREHAQAARDALRELRRSLIRAGVAWKPEVAA